MIKTLNFRESIVGVVNPLAVTRASAINIRDYSGAYLLHEHHTALFYAIGILKQYIAEGLVSNSIFKQFPDELSDVIQAEESQVIALYSQSNCSIIQQYMDNATHTKDDWVDLFKLIQLKHYEVTNDQLQQEIEYFNQQYHTQHIDVNEITKNLNVLSSIARLIERMTFQQSKVERKSFV